MLEGFGQLFGPVRGGLAYAVIFVGAILGAVTGTVAASVIAMAIIALPVMMRYGYDMKLGTGVIAASGTITQLIPPALVLIVLADQLGKPVGDMYRGAIGASILQVAALLPLYSRGEPALSQNDAGAAQGSAHAPWLAARRKTDPRHAAVAGAHLHRARHDPDGSRDADRIGRHGRGGRNRARLVQPQAHLADVLACHGFDHAPFDHGDLHRGRVDDLLLDLPGLLWRAVDRASVDRTCPAARSAF